METTRANDCVRRLEDAALFKTVCVLGTIEARMLYLFLGLTLFCYECAQRIRVVWTVFIERKIDDGGRISMLQRKILDMQ